MDVNRSKKKLLSGAGALLGALTLAASLAVAPPAVAGTSGPFSCGAGQVAGSTEGNAQITYLSAPGYGHCGTLSIRVLYSHVGGQSFTQWTQSAYAGGSVTQRAGNSAMRSEHRTTQPSMFFESWR